MLHLGTPEKVVTIVITLLSWFATWCQVAKGVRVAHLSLDWSSCRKFHLKLMSSTHWLVKNFMTLAPLCSCLQHCLACMSAAEHVACYCISFQLELQAGMLSSRTCLDRHRDVMDVSWTQSWKLHLAAAFTKPVASCNVYNSKACLTFQQSHSRPIVTARLL